MKRLIATPPTFYGHHGRTLTVCVFCSAPCDSDLRYRDHLHGNCVDLNPELYVGSARVLIFRFAREHEYVSANEIRALWPQAWDATEEASRGPAFGVLARRRYLERVGLEHSTARATNRAELNRYQSLIFQTSRQAVAA